MLLPVSLLPFLILPTLSIASPQPALVSEEYVHLIPHHTLFLRQLQNLQTFSGNLGGVSASDVTNSGDTKRPFAVDGDTFTDFQTAAQRSCDNQFNQCSQAANSQGNKGSVRVQDCDEQKNDCRNTLQNARVQDFQTGVASQNIGPDPDFPEFDLICEA
ncbi:hypothetical protein K469DRAFT_695742 [Zopfia rhizophila CBS 207.26]|uniref:Uncharacterized protein n=1 Tax=Zopfia rhizophila CBS 207.26 TaxID=1314779 RepID=A0A6A6DGP8_9PEZI|nr:hypothetical protein K469DRAFT_695742 [Zopfia rhizophila CBS 207.26]